MTEQPVTREGRLATYKHPRDVVFLDALPRNVTGKVQKTVLRGLVAQPSSAGMMAGKRHLVAICHEGPAKARVSG